MKTTKKLFLILLSFLLILPQVTGSLWASAGEAGALPSDATASAAEARSLPVDKTYYLRNANTWNMYLDLQASGTTNSTHFQQYPGYYASELFRLKYQAGGYYPLETTLVGASGRMVMDGRSNCVAGAQVILYQYVSDAPEQLWFIRQNSNGTYCLSPKKNLSLNLSIEGGSHSSNAKVKLANKNDADPSQQWYLEEPVEAVSLLDYTQYYLRNVYSGMYLDLQGNGTTNGTNLQQYPYYAWPGSERFEIMQEEDGYFTIETTIADNMVLDGRSNCVAGAQVILYQETSNSPEQRWHLRRNSNGTFRIAPKKNVYLNLAVDPPSTESHAKVKLANRNDSDPSQQWCLEPAYVRDYDWSYVLYDANQFSYISSGYRSSSRPNHYGIDIIGKSQSIDEQYIYAPADGVIKYTYDWHPSAGNYVVIEFDDYWAGTGRKLRAGYMHMKDPCFFGKGTRIDKGYHIGFVGNTGNSTGPHLHFSVFYGGGDNYWAGSGNCINPQRFFPDVPFTGETSTAE